MKSHRIRIPHFFLLLPWFGAALCGQPAATIRSPAPLGLLRLQDNVRPGQAPALAVGKFAVDDLSAGAAVGASRSRKDGVDVLSIDSGWEWSRPLRGSPRDVSFVSFQLYASSSTGTLQWKSLNFHVGAGKYGGKNLVALPTLTVRLDPATDTWDLYSGSRLLADHLPTIAAKKGQRQFLVRAGGEGAWLTGLVMADENPLYEDANANGIDDAFEKQKRGAILAATASVAERQPLAQEWKHAQRLKPPPALFITRPLSDSR